MKLIDADALAAKWNSLLSRMQMVDDGAYPVDFIAVIYDLNNTPAVDAVPVVHGRWSPSTIQYGFVICNVCGDWRSSHWVEDRFNYCPNCGAKMDGERKGDDAAD